MCDHEYESVKSTGKEIREIIFEILDEEGIDTTEMREKVYTNSLGQLVGFEDYFMERIEYPRDSILLHSTHLSKYDAVCLKCGKCDRRIIKTKIELLKMRKNRLTWENREQVAERLYKENCCK